MDALKIVEAVMDIAEIDKAMAESAEVLKAVMDRAREAREYWIDYWLSFDHPFSREHTLRSGYVEKPGDYENGIRVKFLRTPEGLPMARVTSHDYKSAWVEYGSSHMPEFAPRAATVAHYGGTGKSIES